MKGKTHNQMRVEMSSLLQQNTTMKTADLARLANCSPLTIYRWRHTLKMPPPPKGPWPLRMSRTTHEARKAILRKMATTSTLEEVGKVLGCSRQCVEQLYRRYGISRINHPGTAAWKKEITELLFRHSWGEEKILIDTLRKLATSVGANYLHVQRFVRSLGYEVGNENRLLRGEGKMRCSCCREIKPLELFTKSTYRGETVRLARCAACNRAASKRCYDAKKASILNAL